MTLNLSGDKALADAVADRLGFAATADAIAASIINQPKVDGLVIGIEGRWGSGKSSLVNMMVGALRDTEGNEAPEIVEFKPWLIGDRNSLLLELFTGLAIAVDAIEEGEGDVVGRRRRELGQAGKKIVGFAARLGSLGALGKVAGAVLPGLSLVSDAIVAGSAAAKEWDQQRSISDEKAELRKRLSSLPRRIVVTIDDVDRLEPSEVVEILRLVRSVADFPNVVYVLCYDPGIVAHSIEVAAKVESGRSYIEKIVQVAVSVPQPEAFDLRRWFRSEIDALPYASDEQSAWRSRLDIVIDVEGGRYLSTPRHVSRCLDGIRFFWGALQNQVDLSDLVWLNLVKVGNAKLYSWIELYLTEVAAQVSGGAVISNDDRRASRAALDQALLAEGTTFEYAQHKLSDFLLGVGSSIVYGDENDPGVHSDIFDEQVAEAARLRRLTSPDHYRLYFAIQQPRNAPEMQDFKALFDALDTSFSATSDLLRYWHEQRLSSGVSKAEVMLNRIASAKMEAFGSMRAGVLLGALSHRLDDLVSGRGGPSHFLAWREGERVLRRLLPQLDENRSEVLNAMFQGRSLDWLTSILRRELFAHGRAGERPNGDKVFSSDELNRISEIMVERYRGFSFGEWRALRRPLSALYAWYQAGDPGGPKAMVASQIKTDEGLIEVLELLSIHTMSMGGEFIPLKQSTLQDFMDYPNARSRTEKMAHSAEDPKLKVRAMRMLEHFEYAEGQ